MHSFFEAAKRHLDDGDFLYSDSREPNAVQLWAIGAECVLKSIAEKQHQFTLSTTNRPNGGYAKHIDEKDGTGNQILLSLYNAFQSGPNALIAPTSAFSGWTIHSRYEDGTQLPPASTYVNDVTKFRSLLTTAIAQGILP